MQLKIHSREQADVKKYKLYLSILKSTSGGCLWRGKEFVIVTLQIILKFVMK